MIEDYSLNPEKSPSLSYDITVSNFGDNEHCFPLFHESEMKVIIKCALRTKAVKWIFGSDKFQALPNIADDSDKKSAQYSMAVSQKSGKIFTYKGNKHSKLL